jgi:hypothetical protein
VRLAALLLALCSALPAAAECRLALALALDVSASVDDREYLQQRLGLADALDAPQVRDAFLAMPGVAVELYVNEWSGTETQRLLVPWRRIEAPADLDAVAAALRAPFGPRRDPSTAIGAALAFGAREVRARDCWRRVIDVSGDGPSNRGPEPGDVALDGITVNGLVIGTQEMDYGGTLEQNAGELATYYRAVVVRGPDAFVLIALGFDDYRRAMELKLLREVASLPAAALD